MIKILKLFTLLLFCSVIRVSAQSKTEKLKTFKFGKVGIEEFDTKVTGPDSAAAAIKLFDVGKGSFNISPKSGQFVYYFVRHVRYKVVNKNAYNLADFEIGLYNSSLGGAEEKLQSVHAATYNLVDGKIQVSKMTSDAKFSNRVDKNHIEKKFTLPNVKEGSIIEYTYATLSDFTFALDDWYFQGSYPCKYSSFSLTLPQYYFYKISASGYIDINQLKPEQIQENYIIPSTQNSRSETVTATATRTDYYAEDIPAIKDESFITTLQDYVSKIGFEKTATNFPGSGYKDYSSTWPKLVKELKDDESFGQFIKKSNYDKAFLTGIIKDEKDALAKMNLIFNYVKNNLKWDGKYSYYSLAKSQRAVMEKKSGNSGDINLSLLGILKLAGIDASPVLISTRGNGAHPGYPMLSKFNNVIIQVEIGEQKYLLDATDEDNMENLISYNNLSHQGLKINLDNEDAAWVSIDCPELSKRNITYDVVLGTDNKFTGNLYLSSNNYDGLNRRSTYKAAVNEAEFIKNYKNNKPGLEIDSFKIENLKIPNEALAESMKITMEDNVEDAGDLIYFTPMFFERTKENPFTLEERKFPVDFAHPFEENYRSIIEFPVGYKLDKLPKNESFALPEKQGGFTIIYAAEGNKIAVKSKISIAKSVFTAEEYFYLKELFKNIVRKQAEQIVFKKS